MKYFIAILTTVLLFQSCTKPTPKTELILLGTVHRPVENFNVDSLYKLFVDLQPDLILIEYDSSAFNDQFEFTMTWDGLENNTTIKYKENHPVQLRPYDFTGRNEYRRKIGSRPTDKKATKLLRTMYANGELNDEDKAIFEAYKVVNDSLNIVAFRGAAAFNNAKNDSVAELRQNYQYVKFLEIMSHYPVFANTYHVKEDGDSISYYNGFKLAGEFWNLRNQTMAKHILQFVDEFKGKRIIVLNGYYHRHYLVNELTRKQEEHHFEIKEFYNL